MNITVLQKYNGMTVYAQAVNTSMRLGYKASLSSALFITGCEIGMSKLRIGYYEDRKFYVLGSRMQKA